MRLRNKTLWLVLLTAVLLAGAGSFLGRAATTNDSIAYVDMQAVGERYIKPLIDPPLQQEMQKLQNEFDTKSKGMDDQAKANLFNKYQASLDAKRQELIDTNLNKANAVIKQVAQQAGYKIVLDKVAVLSGGTDLTSQVLSKLGVKK